MATTDLLLGQEVHWIGWCKDGLHAVLLYHHAGKECISVCHVESGTMLASRKCGFDFMWGSDPEQDSAESFVSFEADAVLVPDSLQVISLCRLPSLETVAQLIGPEEAGEATELLSTGWAAQGSLIAAAWLAEDSSMAVTVYSGIDGSLCSTIFLEHHIVLQDSPFFKAGLSSKIMFEGLATCPSQPAAAVAWISSRGNFVILLDLVLGTQTALQRPLKQAVGEQLRCNASSV